MLFFSETVTTKSGGSNEAMHQSTIDKEIAHSLLDLSKAPDQSGGSEEASPKAADDDEQKGL